MKQVLWYLTKCIGACFGMFLIAGATADIYLQGAVITDKNAKEVLSVMFIAMGVGFLSFWPKFPRKN